MHSSHANTGRERERKKLVANWNIATHGTNRKKLGNCSVNITQCPTKSIEAPRHNKNMAHAKQIQTESHLRTNTQSGDYASRIGLKSPHWMRAAFSQHRLCMRWKMTRKAENRTKKREGKKEKSESSIRFFRVCSNSAHHQCINHELAVATAAAAAAIATTVHNISIVVTWHLKSCFSAHPTSSLVCNWKCFASPRSRPRNFHNSNGHKIRGADQSDCDLLDFVELTQHLQLEIINQREILVVCSFDLTFEFAHLYPFTRLICDQRQSW